jgi:hypothetical protein
MSIERGKDLLADIFANYGIDINTWDTYSPEKQQQMASEYKNNKASEQLDDQPPYEAQNIPNTEPSSMQGFLKKARLHDPQGAADLMNAENTPVQTNTDVSEPEIIPKTRGLQPRLAVPQVGLMAKRIAYDKKQKEKLIKRLAIEKQKEKKRKAEDGDNLEENSPLGDIGEKLKNTYDSINNTLSLKNLSELLRNKPVFYAWLKSKGLPMDEYIIKGVQDTIKDAETSIREGIIKPANAVVDANEVVGNKIGEVAGNMKDDKSRSTLSQIMGAGPKGYDWLTDPFTDKDPVGQDFEMSHTADTTGEVSQGLMNTKKDKKKDKKKDVLKKKAEKIFSPHPLDEKKGDPLMNISKETEGYKNKDFEDEDVSSSLKAVQNAKTEAEKEKALPKDKDKRAAVKEQADKYWIDPRTGFALNLTEMDKRMDRKSEMAMAALFPAGDRAAYLYSKKLIDKEDYEMMIKPTEKEEAAALLTSVKTQEHLLKVAELERKASRNPQEKNWIDLYKNAVTNKDYIMQGILGKKLGLKESDLKKSREMSKAQELAKLKGKGKEFKTAFNVEYSTVISNKSDWQKRASAVVMGKENEEFDLNLGTGRPAKFTDRRGYFRSYGLHEQEDALAMSRDKLDKILLKAPMARTFMSDPRYAGPDGKFDSSKFVADKTAYERYLMDTLIFEGMSTLYQPGIYLKMMQYQAKHTKTGTFAKKLTNK